MDTRRAQDIANQWANEAGDKIGDPTRARVVLQRALASFVGDGAPVEVLTDDDAPPLVGAVVGSRLLLLSASANDQDGPIAEARAIALDSQTQLSVTYTVRQAEADGLYSRRSWTIEPANGAPVSFYTASTGREGPDTPFVYSLARALGWTMPDS